ncbi:unnamed protein product [Closterium sp. Yama58-4]|nr:unnamed protein product [Closterium sp. Yama58-4]
MAGWEPDCRPGMTRLKGRSHATVTWYATENFNLALIFHSRLLQHPCRTSDPDSADLLFIPAYLGWMIWSLVEHGLFVKRDEPVADLERFLLNNADFKRLVNRGDHVLVLSRPIWDFVRVKDKPDGWGTDLWWRPTFNNVTLLTVEAPTEWLEREVFSVPYTTCFHPVGSADLEGWVRHVREQPRPYLYSFVGGKRAHATWEGSLRGVLLNECENDPQRCIFLECTVADAEAATAAAVEIGRQAQKWKEGSSREGKEKENEIEPDFPLRGCMDPRRVAGVMLQSEFCLQPLGDSLTRRSFFDSIISGCIPVVFTEGTFDLQYPWFFAPGPEARRNVSVMVDSDDVIGRKVRIGEVLAGISEERKREMREELYKHIPRLLFQLRQLPAVALSLVDRHWSGSSPFTMVRGGAWLVGEIVAACAAGAEGRGEAGVQAAAASLEEEEAVLRDGSMDCSRCEVWHGSWGTLCRRVLVKATREALLRAGGVWAKQQSAVLCLQYMRTDLLKGAGANTSSVEGSTVGVGGAAQLPQQDERHGLVHKSVCGNVCCCGRGGRAGRLLWSARADLAGLHCTRHSMASDTSRGMVRGIARLVGSLNQAGRGGACETAYCTSCGADVMEVNSLSGTFQWQIDGFSELAEASVYSNTFLVGGYCWCVLVLAAFQVVYRRIQPGMRQLLVYPEGGEKSEDLSLYLVVANAATVPPGWTKRMDFVLTVVNQFDRTKSVKNETSNLLFSPRAPNWGWSSMMPLKDLNDLSKGFLVNDTVILEADVKVCNKSKIQTGYVGLNNQGGLCCMAPLIQMLFHIPLFRKAIYRFSASESDLHDGSILLALRSIFYRLQFTDTSVSTKNLTKRVEWEDGDLSKKHDSTFDGFQLDVKGCKDVYASLDKYVEVQKLDGNTKFYVEQHGAQDAKKGVLFVDLPLVLQLHLKRVEYNPVDGKAAKVNDRCEFPLELNLDKDNVFWFTPMVLIAAIATP